MPKSKIIVDFIDKGAPIDETLRRLQVLAHEIHNKELEKWVECELVGYGDDDDLPGYRKVETLDILYEGTYFSRKVKNFPLPEGCLRKEVLNTVQVVNIKEDISSVEVFARGNQDTYRDLSFLSSEVFKRSGGGIRCDIIRQLVPLSSYRKIVAEVRNRVIKALMTLEDQYGRLDKFDLRGSSSKLIRNNAILNESLDLRVNSSNVESFQEKITWRIAIPIFVAVVAALIIGGLGLG